MAAGANKLYGAMAALVLAVTCRATVYYVDNAAGSDRAHGTSPSAAWATLAPLENARLQPGDAVLFKRGQSWNATLSIVRSGSPGEPITFGVYGDGARPILNGAGLNSQHDVVITGLEIRNSGQNGVDMSDCSDITLRDLVVDGNQKHGVIFYNCSNVLIDGAEIYHNGLNASAGYDGVRLDGRGNAGRNLTVQNSRIHDNVGGAGWNSANGIFIGHTGAGFPALQRVRIEKNDIYANGNPEQNQAGRGVTGTFSGDVAIIGNYIHENASAGLYLGNPGTRIDIVLLNNSFYNNALRQFGGFTDGEALVDNNTITVDNPAIAGIGCEIGGKGTWQLNKNTFNYPVASQNRYRAFIGLNDEATKSHLKSDWNLYASPGPQRWRFADGLTLSFVDWQGAGFDKNSTDKW